MCIFCGTWVIVQLVITDVSNHVMNIYRRYGHYYTDFNINGKRIRKKIAATRKDIALQYAADIQLKYLRRDIGIERTDLKLTDLARLYLEYTKTNNSEETYKRNELSLRTFLQNVNVDKALDLKQEIQALLKNCSKNLCPIVFTFLKTGMRKNELLNLEWSDVDFANRQIRIVNKEDKRFHPKGGKERFIPIEDSLHQLLDRL